MKKLILLGSVIAVLFAMESEACVTVSGDGQSYTVDSSGCKH